MPLKTYTIRFMDKPTVHIPCGIHFLISWSVENSFSSIPARLLTHTVDNNRLYAVDAEIIYIYTVLR